MIIQYARWSYTLMPEEWLVCTARDKSPIAWHKLDNQEWDVMIACKRVRQTKEETGNMPMTEEWRRKLYWQTGNYTVINTFILTDLPLYS